MDWGSMINSTDYQAWVNRWMCGFWNVGTDNVCYNLGLGSGFVTVGFAAAVTVMVIAIALFGWIASAIIRLLGVYGLPKMPENEYHLHYRRPVHEGNYFENEDAEEAYPVNYDD